MVVKELMRMDVMIQIEDISKFWKMHMDEIRNIADETLYLLQSDYGGMIGR